MAGTTSRGYRYPQNSDAPNVATDIQNLASDVNTDVGTVSTTASSAQTTANTANSTANTALSTANAALPKATYTAKGDLVGGTGSAAYAALPVGSDGAVLTADSTQTTGLKWASSAPTFSLATVPSVTINSVTQSGTTMTVTTNTAHGFVVGQQVIIGEVFYSNTPTVNPNTNWGVASVVSSTQFTIATATATTPVAYTGGGNVAPYVYRDTSMLKYVNGYWFYADSQSGGMFYSSNGSSWTFTYPNAASTNVTRYITDIAFDGTTYAVIDKLGNIATSTNLTSWTQRSSGFGGSANGYCKVEWCGGSINLFVAIGGNGATPYLSTAPSGGATWTTRTSGTTVGLLNIAFDGTSTIVVTAYNSGGNPQITYSSNGTGWSAVTWTNTYSSVRYVFWNAAYSRWWIGDGQYYQVVQTSNLGISPSLGTTGTASTVVDATYDQAVKWNSTVTSSSGFGIKRGAPQRVYAATKAKIYDLEPIANSSTVSVLTYSSTPTTVNSNFVVLPLEASNSFSIMNGSNLGSNNNYGLWATDGNGRFLIVSSFATFQYYTPRFALLQII